MTITLRSSLILNWTFGVLVVVLFVALYLACSQLWRLTEYRDSRPQGLRRTLERDYTIHDLSDQNLVFTLPKGVVVQDSTPERLATLGKLVEREYILIIRSDDRSRPPESENDSRWMEPYWAHINAR